MERKQEQDIKEYLDKIDLQYSGIRQHKNGEFYVKSLFETIAFVKGDFKRNLVVSLNDVITLCELYIRRIDES